MTPSVLESLNSRIEDLLYNADKELSRENNLLGIVQPVKVCIHMCTHLDFCSQITAHSVTPSGNWNCQGQASCCAGNVTAAPQPLQTISTVSFAQKHTGEKGSDIRRVSMAFLSTCWGLPPRLRGLRICLLCRRWGFDPWVRKLPWRRKWQPTLVFLPENCHGQKSLVGYSP